MSFNHELIELAKAYAKKQHGVMLDDESAEDLLDGLADLYEAFIELVQKKK